MALQWPGTFWLILERSFFPGLGFTVSLTVEVLNTSIFSIPSPFPQSRHICVAISPWAQKLLSMLLVVTFQVIQIVDSNKKVLEYAMKGGMSCQHCPET